MKREEVDVVIYHGGCTDGFASAACAYIFNKNIYFVPGYHVVSSNKKQLEYILSICRNKNVLLVDFCYPLNYIQSLIKVSKDLLILDHHKTAKENMETIEDRYKHFDMSHSGAYLAYEFFLVNSSESQSRMISSSSSNNDLHVSSKIPPLFIQYVEDHDLWKHELPYSEEVSHAIQSIGFDMTRYIEFIQDDSLINSVLVPLGTTIKSCNDKRIENMIKHVHPIFIQITHGGPCYFTALVNTNYLQSEVGNALILKFPLLDFACTFSIEPHNNTTKFSLRSAVDRADCSQIAKMFGGGGHRNAAGMTLPYVVNNIFPCKILDDHHLFSQLSKSFEIASSSAAAAAAANITSSLIQQQQSISADNNNNTIIFNYPNYRKQLATYLLSVKSLDLPSDRQMSNADILVNNQQQQQQHYPDSNYNGKTATITSSIIWRYNKDGKVSALLSVVNLLTKNIQHEKMESMDLLDLLKYWGYYKTTNDSSINSSNSSTSGVDKYSVNVIC